ncbi:hypothetical protein SVIO_034080 [Streptomyces violaceusniger]|uniref:Uncharacterized protein n=1 Tax=Streptomyces violaceusniger TaxID=68280 RepID=A0A4D4KV16_STRVO|nr:hypothetical protein SVIO_034080 [Streptomyces violaceusniger]
MGEGADEAAQRVVGPLPLVGDERPGRAAYPPGHRGRSPGREGPTAVGGAVGEGVEDGVDHRAEHARSALAPARRRAVPDAGTGMGVP